MIRKNTFFKKTRRGKVLRIVEEKYLRDDLGCGSLCGRQLSVQDLTDLANDAYNHQFLIIDTNIALQQMNLLEHNCPAIANIIVLQTVLEETRHQNLSLYRRLKQLLMQELRSFIFFPNEHHSQTYITREKFETPNDRNDRAIRTTANWLKEQTGDGVKFIILTNDIDNMQKAIKGGLESTTIKKYVESKLNEFPQLVDMLAMTTSDLQEEINGPINDSKVASLIEKQNNQKDIYSKHLLMSQITIGVKNKRYFQGIFHAEKNWHDGYVVVHGLEGERVAVKVSGEINVNRAFDGDIVAIELLPQSEWEVLPSAKTNSIPTQEAQRDAPADDEENDEDKIAVKELTAKPSVEDVTNAKYSIGTSRPTGKVIGIITRKWRQYCGSLRGDHDKLSRSGVTTWTVFVPVDKRIPKIRIQTRQLEALSNQRIIVSVDSWPTSSRFPFGHYVKTLGISGNKSVETEVLLLEHDIPCEPFSGKVLACLPPTDWTITEENSKGRTDLRSLPVMSIDPPGCKDIDDALHIRDLPNGNFEVGVHIADVTYFVQPGTALDEEAANRSTSTYLVDKRLDMLPKLLTENLCSLRGGEDHFAFSVIWEMTPNADIVSVDFYKSIIHSIAALAYSEAQMMLEDPDRSDLKASNVKKMNHLAQLLRRRRIEAGALTLASPEVRFVLDSESQNPTDVQMYQTKEAHKLVEEFMLLANITVAKKILRHFPTLSVLRRHPAPSRQQFQMLISAAEAVGFELKVETSKMLADSLDAAVRENDPYFNNVLRILSTRCMCPAQYFCSGEKSQEEWHHYGLAAPIYTHFTSPIRRYADVLVHRLLAAAIGVAPLPNHLMNKGNVHDQCETMNRRHRAAQLAGRASVNLHTLLFFKEKPIREDAYVLSVSTHKISVLIPRFGIEGTISLDPICNESDLKYDPVMHILIFYNSIKVQVFDKVEVQISVEEDISLGCSLHLELVTPSINFKQSKTIPSNDKNENNVEVKNDDDENVVDEEIEDDDDNDEDEKIKSSNIPAKKRKFNTSKVKSKQNKQNKASKRFKTK